MKRYFLMLILFLLLVTSCSIKESVYGKPSELQLIKTKEFVSFLDLTVGSQLINDDGAASRNLNGYLEVSSQRIAANMVARGIANNDEELIEKGIKAVEYGFNYQNEDGSFQNNLNFSVSDPDALEANTFFLQSAGHAYLILSQSEYSTKYLPRLEILKPNILKALQWLEPQKEILYKKAQNAPNRLVFDALAFKLNGIILNNTEYKEIGDKFIKENLRYQQSNGVFLEQGGYDSSYQAVNLLELQIYWLYSDTLEKEISNAVKKGVAWEKTRIKESGEINVDGNTRTGNCQEKFFGKCKEVNYPEVVLSFLYYAKINQDKESELIAKKITAYAIKIT